MSDRQFSEIVASSCGLTAGSFKNDHRSKKEIVERYKVQGNAPGITRGIVRVDQIAMVLAKHCTISLV